MAKMYFGFVHILYIMLLKIRRHAVTPLKFEGLLSIYAFLKIHLASIQYACVCVYI